MIEVLCDRWNSIISIDVCREHTTQKLVFAAFWATICKTLCCMLLDRPLSCLSVCNIDVLWPNGWTDQDETNWHAGRPRPRPGPHCVRWGPSSPAKGAQQPPLFSTHVYCGRGRPSQLLLSTCISFFSRKFANHFPCIRNAKKQNYIVRCNRVLNTSSMTSEKNI